MTESPALAAKETNNLFPVFLKLENLRLLIVGGGAIGLEKLNAVVNNSPATKINVVATSICQEIKDLASKHSAIQFTERSFESGDLDGIDLMIVAVNDPATSQAIQQLAKSKEILINVADKPELCDFYLGSVVKKGNLKIAISTNGKSPTIAKRLKEIFSDSLPDQVDDLLENMHIIRGKLNGNLSSRIIKLNQITETLVERNDSFSQTFGEKQWKRIASYFLFAFFFMFLGHLILSYVPISELFQEFKRVALGIDSNFYWMIGAGFLAQMVDG
jgi:siroheme synthase-like protein